MTKIIIITGKAQAGKTTAAYAIRDRYPHSKIYNFADPLKEICGQIFDIDQSLLWGDADAKEAETRITWGKLPLKNEEWSQLSYQRYREGKAIYTNTRMTVRELLQIFGTNICRRMYPDCWANATLQQIKKDNPDIAILADARFPNEIDFFEKFFPFVIKLCRNPLDIAHYSETALDNYPWDKLKHYINIDNRRLSLDAKNKVVLAAIDMHMNAYA